MRNQFKVLTEKYEEAINNTSPTPVKGRYIYFLDGDELYQLKPYKQIQPNGMIMSMASNWSRATVMQGEDVRDVLGIEVDDTSKWYVVNGAPNDHTFIAYIGT